MGLTTAVLALAVVAAPLDDFDKKQIDQVVQAHRDGLRACFGDDSIGARVQFRLLASGKPAAVRAIRITRVDAAATPCARAWLEAEAWFPLWPATPEAPRVSEPKRRPVPKEL